MKRALAGLLFLVCGLALPVHAAPINLYMSAPAFAKSLMGTSELEDLFEHCPRYSIGQAAQINLAGDWGGAEDYAATLRTAWTPEGIFFRFDIKDDFFLPVSKSGKADQPTGDSIVMSFRHQTAGPYRARNELPFNLTLQPDPDRDQCAVAVGAQSGADFAKIGAPTAKLFRIIGTPNEYSIIVLLPFATWDDKPRVGGSLQVQVSFQDSDKAGMINHAFSLFPPELPGQAAGQTFGRIHFVDNLWINCFPAQVFFAGEAMDLVVDYGNLSAQAAEVEIMLERIEPRQAMPQGMRRLLLEPGQVEQRAKVPMDLTGLPLGRYRLMARAGVFADPEAQVIEKQAKAILFPSLLESRASEVPTPARDLPIYQDAALAQQTFRYLAGSGQVLWSAGQYDGSFAEFGQGEKILPAGPLTVDLPTATAGDLPWALFGGRNSLDGHAEPLVLRLNAALFRDADAIQPIVPSFESYQGNLAARALSKSARRLLLIGVLVDRSNDQGYPEIKVAVPGTPEQVLLQQVLRPSGTAQANRQVFVLRVWLGVRDTSISIENVSKFGGKLRFDFMALLSGGPAVDTGEGQPLLRFSGPPEAEIFNRQLTTSLWLMRHYLVDKTGGTFGSLPGGRYEGFSQLDQGLLLGELAHWGATSEAQRIVQGLLYQGQRLSGTPLANLPHVGQGALLSGVFQAWRYLGRNADLVRPVWVAAIHRTATALVNEQQGHPLALFNGYGPMGSPGPQTPAATLPMFFSSYTGLLSAADMAAGANFADTAVSWRSATGRMNQALHRSLAAPKSRLKVSDLAMGVATELPENTLVYALSPAGKVLAGLGGERVYDSPAIFSHLLFHTDYHGYNLAADLRPHLQETFNFVVNFSTAFQSPAARKYNLMENMPANYQMWTVMASLLLDNPRMAAELLNGAIRYNYNELLPLPVPPAMAGADAALSPFTFKERLNVRENGSNPGPSHDELNALGGVTGLRTARLMAGIDDSNTRELRLSPRLPDGWARVEATNWLVAQDLSGKRLAKINMAFDRLTEERYTLSFSSNERLSQVTVRIGPFPLKTQRVRLVQGNDRETVTTVQEGLGSWAIRTYRGINSLNLSAQASN